MKKIILAVFTLLAATAIACGFNFSTANISEVTLAKDEAGAEPATVFDQDDTIYAVIQVANAPDDTKTKAVWTAVEAEGVEPNFVIEETEYVGSDVSYFSLSNDQLWPVGRYKVDIYLNDELNRTLEFEVEGDVAAAEPPPATEPEAAPTEEPTAEPTEEATEEPTAEPTEEPATEPTEEAMAEPLEEGVLFAETFDSDANGWATGEFEDDLSQREILIEDGRYVFDLQAVETVYAEEVLPDQTFSDFILTVEATPSGQGEHYSYGVIFRLDAEGNGYAFEVGNDGLYSVMRYDGEWTALQDWTLTEAIIPGETNELTVAAEGNTMSFYVNGQGLTMVEDETVAEGQIGLVVEIFEEGESASVEFDNLVVREPGTLDLPDIEVPEALALQEEPYTHPSGAFSFAVPEGWEILNEDANSGSVGTETAAVGTAFTNPGGVYSEEEFQAFIDNFTESFISSFATSHEIIEQTPQPDDSIYVAATFESEDGPGQVDMFFEQRDTVVFVFYLLTTTYDEVLPTWNEIIGTYSVDPEAALAAAPAPAQPAQEPVAPAAPTPPPPPPGPSVPAGKGIMLFRNNTGVDFIIDVIGPTNDSKVIPPQSSHEFVLDPGQYTINGHSPGGDYVINAYSFEIAVGQVFPIDLN